MGFSARQRWAKVFVFLIALQDVLSVYQWKISDDEREIQAVPESPFAMAYPGSLVDFLQQFEQIKQFGQSFDELKKTMNSIQEREGRDDPNIEDKIRLNNIHCQRTKDKGLKPNPETFHLVYSGDACPEFHQMNQEVANEMVKNYKGNPKIEGPVCNVDAETLKQTNVKGKRELGLSHILKMYFRDFNVRYKFDARNPELFGNALAQMIESNPMNVYAHMAALSYWRYLGETGKAEACGNKLMKLVGSPGDDDLKLSAYVFISLASLSLSRNEMLNANVLLSQKAIVDSSDSCVAWLKSTLFGDFVNEEWEVKETKTAHDYELDPHFRKKLEYYDQALRIMQEAGVSSDHDLQIFETTLKDKVSTLMCHMQIIKELSEQKNNLENLAKEKLHFNEVYGAQKSIEEQIVSRIVMPDARSQQQWAYEMLKYGPNNHRVCQVTNVLKFPMSSSLTSAVRCVVSDLEKYEKSMLANRRKTLQNRPALNDTTWRVVELFHRDRSFEKRLDNLKAKIPFEWEPHVAPKYPKNGSNFPWRRADWPTAFDCQSILSRTDIFTPESYPQVWISPENKGFIVSEYLTKGIGLGVDERHPLPWHEPYCPSPTDIRTNELSIIFEGVRDALKLQPSDEYAEPRLKTILVRLAGRVLDEAEVGQRIKTMLDHNLGPRWLAMNMAGLYWRVKGNPQQATMCLIQAVILMPMQYDIALTQLSSVILKASGMKKKDEAQHMLQMADGLGVGEPYVYWLMGRIRLLSSDVDGALSSLKEAMDRDPEDLWVKEDLLKVACSGKSSKAAISSLYPTVCCSMSVQNAVCFKTVNKEQGHVLVDICYVVDPDTGGLIYNRCNGVYQGICMRTTVFAQMVSPFLPIFKTVAKKDSLPFDNVAEVVQTVQSPELPLDYGGEAAFMAPRPQEWWSRAKHEMIYQRVQEKQTHDTWEETHNSDLAFLPPKPLSFLWMKGRSEMLEWDVQLPEVLPKPDLHLISQGYSHFGVPRRVVAQECNGVNKLAILLEKQVSTWVSVTAKGEDIEKYVDLRGPVPSIAGLQPVCPSGDRIGSSPILGLGHLPAFSLADQFLFYKPETSLANALKSLGNERDSIEHVAARLHMALLADGMGHEKPVNWLLCVLSSLYWRVTGDAPKAVGCLQCALQTAPQNMRDVVLISLANVCHQSGLLNSALISAGAALSTSPNLVAIHFTIANIYASMGDYQRALNFYFSTLALQNNFEHAKERIRAIYCHSDETFTFPGQRTKL